MLCSESGTVGFPYRQKTIETMKIFLETERLILRQLTEDDASNLFELNSDPDVVRFTPEANRPNDYAVIKTRTLPRYIAYYEKYNGYGFWAVIEKSSQEFIGWFLLRPAVEAPYFDPALAHPSDIELAYRLRKASWGKGYASEGVKALILKSFSELETQHIVAVALAANVVSIRVMEKVGLKLERRMMYEPLGQEIVMYALRRDEFKPENSATT